VDGSHPSTRAVEQAGRLAAQVGGAVTVFHLRHEPAGRFASADEPVDEAQALVDTARDALRRAGVADVNSRIDPGIAGQETQAILDVAKEIGADLIVIGTHGRSALAGLVIGSVTYRLIHLSTVPVLVVR
jgi:nucleotide-binding universal stress UspA family protein